jgi:hypothetical protein
MLKARSEVRLVPSLAEITILENVPTFEEVGVPVSAPVDVLNAAQLGRFAIDQVSVRPSGSEPVGRNEYALPTVTEVAGVPLTTGARLVVPPLDLATTAMENAGKLAVPVALLTEMRMFEYVPGVVGVAPSRRPVYTENLAHAGLLTMENRSVDAATAGSRAVGWKLYQEFVPKLVYGVPEIVGAASTTLLIKVSAQTSAKNSADTPKAGAR